MERVKDNRIQETRVNREPNKANEPDCIVFPLPHASGMKSGLQQVIRGRSAAKEAVIKEDASGNQGCPRECFGMITLRARGREES